MARFYLMYEPTRAEMEDLVMVAKRTNNPEEEERWFQQMRRAPREQNLKGFISDLNFMGKMLKI